MSTEMIKQEPQHTEHLQQRPVVVPPVDIYENDNEVLLLADMPGVDKKNIHIQLHEGQLTIEGPREAAPEVSANKGWPAFDYRRVFKVHQRIDVDKISAHLEHGVLRIQLPKAAEVRPRQIQIQKG